MSKSEAIERRKPVTIEAVPEFLRSQGRNRGLENVEREDMTLPRVGIAQSQSKALKKSSPTRIEGLEEGGLYNSLTREVYGACLEVVPVLFFKNYIKFKSMEEGGGVLGMADDRSKLPPGALDFHGDKKPEWTEFKNFVCWLPAQQAVASVSMKSTSMKTARKWNSLMRFANVPAFGKVYKLTTVLEHKDSNDYYVYEVEALHFVDEELFKQCENLYALMKDSSLKIDLSEEEGDTEFHSGESKEF